MGRNTKAIGAHSTAMGSSTEASGGLSTAMGLSTIASGEGSIAMGSQTTALGNYATAMGSQTKAETYPSTAIGHYNTGGGSPDSYLDTDPLFEIGNGTDDARRTNALTVLRNGTILAPTFDTTEITHAKALVTKEYADAQDAAAKTFVVDLVATFEARIKVLERQLVAVGQSTPAINPVDVGGQTTP
jgi:hypothetical protein